MKVIYKDLSIREVKKVTQFVKTERTKKKLKEMKKNCNFTNKSVFKGCI